jgi:hypothetical protein
MEARIEAVAETTRMIEPFSQETVKAISAGAQITTIAVQATIEARASSSFQFGESLYSKLYSRVSHLLTDGIPDDE